VTGFAAADRAWMEQALACARAAEAAGEVPVGAVIVDGEGVVLAEASNAPIGSNDPTAHAEILALREAGRRRANYRLPDCRLFVTLEPCPMCTSALVHARVAEIVYAAADLRTGACGSVFDLASDEALNHRIEVRGGLMADESAALLRAFFGARRFR
jgi:tRNA(adenine34) deaminase